MATDDVVEKEIYYIGGRRKCSCFVSLPKLQNRPSSTVIIFHGYTSMCRVLAQVLTLILVRDLNSNLNSCRYKLVPVLTVTLHLTTDVSD